MGLESFSNRRVHDAPKPLIASVLLLWWRLDAVRHDQPPKFATMLGLACMVARMKAGRAGPVTRSTLT